MNIKTLILVILIIGLTACSSANPSEKAIATKVQIGEDGFPVFHIYGEKSPLDYLDGENIITEKYGFRLKRVAGCEIEHEEVNKIKLHNKNALRYMNEKYGNNWKSKFEEETNLKLAIPF